jgi:glycosyltransferase involved in cell wall biosynthesis
VVASRTGAVMEVAGPAAELADPEDADEWAAALERLLTDPDRRADLIDAGRRHAATFSWQATAAGLAALYLRLANSS